MSMRVISWEDFVAGAENPDGQAIAATIGVFDGIHRGHQALIERICNSSYIPMVVTFRQNPLQILRPHDFPGDIFSLGQKMRVFESMGVQQLVVIDFSESFSIINGRDFIDLLLQSSQVKFLALGRNFRCGYQLDTGIQEIGEQATVRGVETWAAEPVMEDGRAVSSSRIRRAITAGKLVEAARLLSRNVEIDLSGLPADISFPQGVLCRSFNAAAVFRIVPSCGRYRALLYGDNSANGIETELSIEDGKIIVLSTVSESQFIPQRIELLDRFHSAKFWNN